MCNSQLHPLPLLLGEELVEANVDGRVHRLVEREGGDKSAKILRGTSSVLFLHLFPVSTAQLLKI